MLKIDRIDAFILESLQKNGRMTNVELSTKVGISAPPCLRRLKNLEREGIIRGYHAEVDSSFVGYSFSAFCFVSLESQSSILMEEFTKKIISMDLVRGCSRVSGDFDFILTVVAKSLDEYENLVLDNLSRFNLIKQIKTYPVMKLLKDEKGIPICGNKQC